MIIYFRSWILNIVILSKDLIKREQLSKYFLNNYFLNIDILSVLLIENNSANTFESNFF